MRNRKFVELLIRLLNKGNKQINEMIMYGGLKMNKTNDDNEYSSNEN